MNDQIRSQQKQPDRLPSAPGVDQDDPPITDNAGKSEEQQPKRNRPWFAPGRGFSRSMTLAVVIFTFCNVLIGWLQWKAMREELAEIARSNALTAKAIAEASAANDIAANTLVASKEQAVLTRQEAAAASAAQLDEMKASNAVALRGIDESRRNAIASLEESKRQADASLQLTKQNLEAARKAAQEANDMTAKALWVARRQANIAERGLRLSTRSILSIEGIERFDPRHSFAVWLRIANKGRADANYDITWHYGVGSIDDWAFSLMMFDGPRIVRGTEPLQGTPFSGIVPAGENVRVSLLFSDDAIDDALFRKNSNWLYLAGNVNYSDETKLPARTLAFCYSYVPFFRNCDRPACREVLNSLGFREDRWEDCPENNLTTEQKEDAGQ